MGKLTIELKSFQTIFPQAMAGFEQEHQRFSTTQNQVGYIVEALHSRVKYSYSYFVQSKIDTRKGFRNRKNCETGSIGSAKADVAPLCICLGHWDLFRQGCDGPPFSVFLTYSCIYFAM